MLTSDIAMLLESAYEMRKEIVPLLMGEPGIGKTQGVYDFAERKGVKVVELYLSQMSPLEISGMTMPNEADHSMQVFDSKRLDSLEDGDVLFLDELLQAPQQVLAACLTLIQERRMLSGKMLPDVFIVAAANPIENMDTRIPLSIRQRFMAVEVVFDDDAWTMYMQSRGMLAKVDDIKLVHGASYSNRFNRCTPRSLTKLCEWFFSAKDKGFVLKTIGDMFGADVKDVVDDIYMRSINPVKKDLVSAINDQMKDMKDGSSIDHQAVIRLSDIKERMLDDKLSDSDLIEDAVKRIFKNIDAYPVLMEHLKGIDIGESLAKQAVEIQQEQEQEQEQEEQEQEREEQEREEQEKEENHETVYSA